MREIWVVERRNKPAKEWIIHTRHTNEKYARRTLERHSNYYGTEKYAWRVQRYIPAPGEPE